MVAMYEDNFKKFLEKYNLSKAKISIPDLFRYPCNEMVSAHPHTTHSLFPWTEKYASSLNHINLFDVVSYKQLLAFSHVLVRDGFFTIIDFFNRFPTPKNIETILIIHSKFSEYAPSEWHEKVLFYDFEIYDRDVSKNQANEALLVKGLLMSGAFDLENFKDEMSAILGKNKFKRINFAIRPAQNYFLTKEWKGPEDFAEYSNGLMRFVFGELAQKVDVSFITPKELASLQHLDGSVFYDLNNKNHYYMDDGVDFFLLSRGAKPVVQLEDIGKNEFDLKIPLSHFHGVRIFSSVEINEDQERFKRIISQLRILGIEDGEKLNEAGFHLLYDKF